MGGWMHRIIIYGSGTEGFLYCFVQHGVCELSQAIASCKMIFVKELSKCQLASPFVANMRKLVIDGFHQELNMTFLLFILDFVGGRLDDLPELSHGYYIKACVTVVFEEAIRNRRAIPHLDIFLDTFYVYIS